MGQSAAPVAGSNGLTIVATDNSANKLGGGNTYTGKTTLTAGCLTTTASDAFPDNGLVELHPGTILQIGTISQSTERIGSISGAGTVRLGGNGSTTVGTLIIGPGSGAAGKITLAGGSISPGLSIGTLTIGTTTTPVNNIDFVMNSGSLMIDLASLVSNDMLAVSGNTTINGGNLNLSLLDGFVPSLGDSWTILTANSVVDGNGAGLFDSITPGFQASIMDGDRVVLTYVPEPSTIVLLLSLALAGAIPLARRWIIGLTGKG